MPSAEFPQKWAILSLYLGIVGIRLEIVLQARGKRRYFPAIEGYSKVWHGECTGGTRSTYLGDRG